jgi:SAM-dependent methyltransferase
MTRAHWERVYRDKDPERVSWYRATLDLSLRILRGLELPRDARIVDVGGGAATLVDDLLDEGFTRVVVLDHAAPALEAAKARLGERAADVTWIVDDAITHPFEPGGVDLWHDRAVFHFQTDDATRDAYVDQVTRSVRPGGHVVVATFALHGPEKCSGLPVRRHDADGLAATFAEGFEEVARLTEDHVTPWGSVQPFVYVALRRRA